MGWGYNNKYNGKVSVLAMVHPDAQIGDGAVIHPGVVIYPRVNIGPHAVIYANAVIGRPRQKPGEDESYSEKITEIEPQAVIGSGATIYTGTHIGYRSMIGDGVRIREDCFIADNAIVGNNSTFQSNVHLGWDSRVIDLSHITHGVKIGDHSFVSTGVLTMDDNSFGTNYEPDPPEVGEYVHIGGGAILLPGVKIGGYATVAAGAVVTKDVEDGGTVVGVPAKPRPA